MELSACLRGAFPRVVGRTRLSLQRGWRRLFLEEWSGWVFMSASVSTTPHPSVYQPTNPLLLVPALSSHAMEDRQEPTAPAETISITDWISAICSVIAAGVALITLITVYVAARQVLTEHKAYSTGLSREALGPWHIKVKTKQLLGLQQTIATPLISVPHVVKSNWQPEFVFPTGFSKPQEDPSNDITLQSRWKRILHAIQGKRAGNHRGSYSPIEMEQAPVRATWVNFFQALNIRPDNPEHNRFYRMREQSTLVNGTIPVTWTGFDLCSVASILGFQSCESEPRYREPLPLPTQWYSPIGRLQFRLSDEGCVVDFTPNPQYNHQLPPVLYNYYKNKPKPSDAHSLTARLWWPIDGLALKDGHTLYIDYQNCNLSNPKGTVNWLIPVLSPGLLTNVFTGYVAKTRGFDFGTCYQYNCRNTDTTSDEDLRNFPYALGRLRMDKELLRKVKGAVELLKPDGYYLTPSGILTRSLRYIFNAAYQRKHKQHIFRPLVLRQLEERPERARLYHAMLLCNEVHDILAKWATNEFPINDMVVMAKASHEIRNNNKATELSWAMLISPELFTDMEELFEKHISAHELDETVQCQGEVLDCTELLRGHLSPRGGDDASRTAHTYATPLCAEGKYTGWELLTAFTELMIVSFWIQTKWMTNVAQYVRGIPQTVIMC
ncbi:hypothetical protein VTJ83DRAFT_2904 [Remersonia thermophila]|uniref:Uncharacterized protein n=1 Tax=Remersonia thermophila TaxID=72144 RepID=A0ABR4DCH9_9PEZI